MEFFGYRCSYGKFELTGKRKQAIMDIPFPKNTKQMQRFLGCALFFQKFMPNYSTLTARLNDMTEKSFDWKQSSWTHDYESYFVNFKNELVKATALFYPDYSLPWSLRVDASDDGVGFVLLQYPETPEGEPAGKTEPLAQPLLFGSKKFSKQARSWDTFNKEAFAQYYAIKECEYYLRGKKFTLEGDHANLRWIDASMVPKVIRLRVYMQSFAFNFNHISGKKNIVADWQSRLFSIQEEATVDLAAEAEAIGDDEDDEDEATRISKSDMLKSVHGAKSRCHFGVARTYDLLNKHFPGHGISMNQVSEFVRECPECQKVRLGMDSALVPIVRHLKTRGPRRMLGIDYLELSPDDFGYIGMYVIRDHFTKHVFLWPVKEHNATTAATALFMHCVYFGSFDCLISDPGFDFTSNMIQLLNSWFGIHHIFSLVDVHTSNGVEGANKQILRHIKTLMCEEHVRKHWSSPTVIGWIMFLMNKFDESESGNSPYALTFGSEVVRNLRFPANSLDHSSAPAFLKQLDNNLAALQAAAFKFQQQLVAERVKNNGQQNMYQATDLVLYKRSTDKPLPDKLDFRYAGPYEVIQHRRNDVECRHLSLGHVKVFPVETLKPYIGDREKARQLANLDAQQYDVDKFLAYRGNPMKRTHIMFLVRFADSEEIWLPWSEDLFNTIAYEEFCRTRAPLFPLLYRLKEAKNIIRDLQKSPIVDVEPNDEVYVDLRCYDNTDDGTWYQNLKLPDADMKTYVVKYKYLRWMKQDLTLEARCPLFKENFQVDHLIIKQYGSVFNFDEATMVLVDENFVQRFPQVLPKGWQHRR